MNASSHLTDNVALLTHETSLLMRVPRESTATVTALVAS